MRTILFLAVIFITTCLSAQTLTTVKTSILGFQPPIGEWYLLDEKGYDSVYYMDHVDENLAEEQINFTLNEFGTSMEFGNLVEHVDGFFYYEWDAMGKDMRGNDAPAYITYMMRHDDPYFFRISIQYME